MSLLHGFQDFIFSCVLNQQRNGSVSLPVSQSRRLTFVYRFPCQTYHCNTKVSITTIAKNVSGRWEWKGDRIGEPMVCAQNVMGSKLQNLQKPSAENLFTEISSI